MPDRRSTIRIVVYILLAAGTVLLVYLSFDMTRPKGRIVRILTLWGGMTFFLGGIMDSLMRGPFHHAGFLKSRRFGTTSTPIEIWRFLGILLWTLAIGCLLLMD